MSKRSKRYRLVSILMDVAKAADIIFIRLPAMIASEILLAPFTGDDTSIPTF